MAFARTRIHPYAGPSPTALTPAQVAALYAFPTASGASKTVAIISLGGGHSTADLQAAGIDPSRVAVVTVDGAANQYSGNPQSADLENALDLQVIGGACGAKIKIFYTPNSDQGFRDAIAAAMADPAVCCLSISWGAAETDWAAASIQAMRAAISGSKPVFVASGDNGPDDSTNQPVADFPACAEHATACGGTKLIAAGTQIASEIDWNDSTIGGGEEGYGVSRSVPAPSWQGGSGGRHIPDIVLNAAPETGYPIHLNGQVIVVGGTSAAAPMAAAGYARLCEQMGSATPADFNTACYGAGSVAFNTVTLDAGDPPLCVGLGSPNLAKLIATLTPSKPVQPPSPTPTPTCLQTVNASYTEQLAEIKAAIPPGGDVLVTVPWYATLTRAVSWSQESTDTDILNAHPDVLAVLEHPAVPAPPERRVPAVRPPGPERRAP